MRPSLHNAWSSGRSKSGSSSPRLSVASPYTIEADRRDARLDKGESINALNSGFAATELNTALISTPYPLPDGGTGTELSVRPDKFHEVFAADVPQSTTDVAAAAQRPAAVNSFAESATAAAWHTIPSWDLITVQDHVIDPGEQEFMAERAGAYTEQVDSSHAVTLSKPSVVTSLIEQAAQAVSR